MMVVKQQGMEVLGVNLSPSVSFKDRFAVRPHVMWCSLVLVLNVLCDASFITIPRIHVLALCISIRYAR